VEMLKAIARGQICRGDSRIAPTVNLARLNILDIVF
jgi:hypothetical protein